MLACFTNSLMDFRRRLLIIWFCFASSYLAWLLMCATHEFGHMLHAWGSGGSVSKLVLSPFAISRTDVHPNHHPRFVVWGGFIWGTAIPVVIWLIASFLKCRWASWSEFFCGFCLVANGAYLSSGFWSPSGDTRNLLRLGESPILMLAIGVMLATAGVWQWHRLDKRAEPDWTDRVTRKQVAHVTVWLTVVMLLELTVCA